MERGSSTGGVTYGELMDALGKWLKPPDNKDHMLHSPEKDTVFVKHNLVWKTHRSQIRRRTPARTFLSFEFYFLKIKDDGSLSRSTRSTKYLSCVFSHSLVHPVRIFFDTRTSNGCQVVDQAALVLVSGFLRAC